MTRLDWCMFALANATFYALFAELFVAALQVAMEMFHSVHLYTLTQLSH